MLGYARSLMHTIDEIATDNSEYGYRYIYRQLIEDGYIIGKDRVLKYMQSMGIQAIYPTKKRLTSIKNPEHKIYEYLEVLEKELKKLGMEQTIDIALPELIKLIKELQRVNANFDFTRYSFRGKRKYQFYNAL